MFVDVKGVMITLAAIAAVVLVCALDVKCSGSARDAGVMARISSELKAGRKASAENRRDSIAAQLRVLRALNKKLVREGNVKQSRRVTAAILELEEQYKNIK